MDDGHGRIVPIGTVAVHLGALVKPVRAPMLGPIVLGLSLLTQRLRDEEDKAAPHVTVGDHSAAGKLPLYKLAP